MTKLKTEVCYELELSRPRAFYVASVADGSELGERMRIFAGHYHDKETGENRPVDPTGLLEAVVKCNSDASWWRAVPGTPVQLSALESALWGPLTRGSYKPRYWQGGAIWRPVELRANAGGIWLKLCDDHVGECEVRMSPQSGHAPEPLSFTLAMPTKHGLAEIAVELPSDRREFWAEVGEYLERQMTKRMRFFRGEGRSDWVEVKEFGEL